jgi:hypothetical protein
MQDVLATPPQQIRFDDGSHEDFEGTDTFEGR